MDLWLGINYVWFFSWVLNMFGLLRVDAFDEDLGMDLTIHKGSAYESDNSESKSYLRKMRAVSRSDSF